MGKREKEKKIRKRTIVKILSEKRAIEGRENEGKE